MKLSASLPIAALGVLGVLFCAGTSHADPAGLGEKKIQASLVYNFLKQTAWSESKDAQVRDYHAEKNSGSEAPAAEAINENTLYICMLGGDAFSGYLSSLEGRSAQLRPIHVLEIKKVDEAKGCHIVFIHYTLESKVLAMLESLKGESTLTMSNIPFFAQAGGMAEVSVGQDGRVHLYVNRDAIEQAKLEIAPRLLNLAEITRAE